MGGVLFWRSCRLGHILHNEVQPSACIERYRRSIGAIGGAAVLALFPAQSGLFAAYGIGLAVGFFVYVVILIIATLSTAGLKGLADQQDKKNPFMGG